MNYKKMLTGICAGLLLYVCGGQAAAALPPDAPKDVKHILGFYYGNGENILIRENGGRLELLYRFEPNDKNFAGANIYPLHKEHFDAYTLNEAGPDTSSETSVKFERDRDGYGIACRVGGHVYSRLFFGQTTGERAAVFRVSPHSAEEWAALRAQAVAAVMPVALSEGQEAELVELQGSAGLKLDSRYATAANCFGAPLYTSSGLWLERGAAEALARVRERLAVHGYGLVVWDAYRPWSVSKLANLALPEKQKDLLEDPEKKGSAHNTGASVDVSLFDLQTEEEIEMISGFDEPSLRQFSAYAGGTSRLRYLRTLLREEMELQGFKGIEGEWWHFDYLPATKWAHLNRNME